MNFFSIVIIFLLCLPVLAQDAVNNCFKIGDEWHDITLPSDMKHVRWLFGDDKDQTPFMSITFDIDSSQFESWALSCGVDLDSIRKKRYWSIDLDDLKTKTGGFVSVVKLKNDRYCIGVERTAQSGIVKKVNGKSYLGCPIRGVIDY